MGDAAASPHLNPIDAHCDTADLCLLRMRLLLHLDGVRGDAGQPGETRASLTPDQSQLKKISIAFSNQWKGGGTTPT